MSYKHRSLLGHMKAAWAYASLSRAERNKVGAVLVKHDIPIASGCNGTYPGDDNRCEHMGVTKPEVIHAEVNTLDKLRFIHETSIGATLVSTHEPCLGCAREIWKARIEHVVFDQFYKSEKSPSTWDGLDYLVRKGVTVDKMCTRVNPQTGVEEFELIRINDRWLYNAREGMVHSWYEYWPAQS